MCACPTCTRGPGLRRGLRLQVYRDVGCAASQCPGTVRGRCAPDTPAQGQQRGQCSSASRHPAARESWQEGKALPGPHCSPQQPQDGLSCQVQVLPRSLGTLGPMGTHCVVQTGGQIGGLAQPTALGASGLAQTLGVPHLMVMDRQCCPGKWFPGAVKGWAHRGGYAGPCASQAAAGAKPTRQACVRGEDSAFLYTRCACPGGRLFSAVAICLHADFCNKDYFLVGQGCGLCVSLVGVEGRCRTGQGSLS